MNDFKYIDTWTDESFEDIITRSMIALYETKLSHKMKMVIPARRLDTDYLQRIRKHGIIVPAPDRLYWNPSERGRQLQERIILPISGAYSLGEDVDNSDPDHMNSYCRVEYFRRVKRLPQSMLAIAPGFLYETVSLYPQLEGEVEGVRDFVTLNPNSGRITPCIMKGRHRQEAIQDRLNDKGAKTEVILNIGLQIVDDFQHQWRITAVNNDTKVTVGAYAENVKSLLYARTLPMTPSGRKRPILHAVRAHRRRLKEGTEIDISKFLRGTREIEMDGTLFKVDAPEKLVQEILDAKVK